MSAARNYLTEDNSIRSWFFTTDHKRIAILYFVGITLFFFIGGAAATLIRLELIDAAWPISSRSDTYNRLFTMHGIIMVWFFLIPSIPVDVGKFPRAVDDRRAGLGISAAQSDQLVSVHGSAAR